MDKLRMEALDKLETELGYRFNDIALLDTALTHSSYVKGDGNATAHNERLEFLGDAVLELCISKYLYRTFPEMDEGVMTRIRSLAVYEPALYAAAQSYGVGDALLLSRGEERSGGRNKPSILADAMEAVIGAIFVDAGLQPANELILRFAKDSIHAAITGLNAKDYKTMLQEYVQKNRLGNVSYVLADSSGPDHKKNFVINAVVAGQALGSGTGHSKQDAGQQAAKSALEHYGQI